MAIVHRMTYQDLIAQPDDGCLHELVRGEILRVPPPKGFHGFIEAAIVGAIDRPSETAAYSNQKVTDNLAGGARLVWQLYPMARNARVYQSDGRTWTIAPGGVLDGGDVLPGFTVTMAELFE